MMYHFIRSGTFKPCPRQKITIPLLRESPWVICLSEEPKVCAVFHTQGMCQNAPRKIIQLKEKNSGGRCDHLFVARDFAYAFSRYIELYNGK